GTEMVSISGINDNMSIMPKLNCSIKTSSGNIININVTALIQTEGELEYLKNGNILRRVVKQLHDSQ
ncbi:MAG: hypothetical protein SFT68_04205, partial [Rickettsiaceae bacterium]|nr:hypothetical protein [Rickettsiaceae bacterium]